MHVAGSDQSMHGDKGMRMDACMVSVVVVVAAVDHHHRTSCVIIVQLPAVDRVAAPHVHAHIMFMWILLGFSTPFSRIYICICKNGKKIIIKQGVDWCHKHFWKCIIERIGFQVGVGTEIEGKIWQKFCGFFLCNGPPQFN